MKSQQAWVNSTSVMQALKNIKDRQGLSINTNGAIGAVVGMITAKVGDVGGNMILFDGGITFPVAVPMVNETEWGVIMATLDDYNIILMLNGTGVLTENLNYVRSPTNSITRIDGFEYQTDEVYTILLIAK